ncbi:hypothetical protein ALC53_04088 [Atta colombica]|uniref:Uncharacterized protein n=1 Tax=Atta colombica TaxID=520822 RepID=A0A195BML1_9HYME|nr:hypothetical protein ALC53_04088 [Atta colombica]
MAPNFGATHPEQVERTKPCRKVFYYFAVCTIANKILMFKDSRIRVFSLLLPKIWPIDARGWPDRHAIRYDPNNSIPDPSIPDTTDAIKLQSSRTQEQSSHIPVKLTSSIWYKASMHQIVKLPNIGYRISENDTNDIRLFNRIIQKFQIIPDTGYFSHILCSAARPALRSRNLLLNPRYIFGHVYIDDILRRIALKRCIAIQRSRSNTAQLITSCDRIEKYQSASTVSITIIPVLESYLQFEFLYLLCNQITKNRNSVFDLYLTNYRYSSHPSLVGVKMTEIISAPSHNISCFINNVFKIGRTGP